MNTHMRTHSYKYVQYQCEKCDFCGGDDYTMEVHIAKHHDDKFECGLCEYVAKNLEMLETHLTTCETYICNICKTKFTTLPDVKTHFLNELEAKQALRSVSHVKQSRESKEEYNNNTYPYLELFPYLKAMK